MSSYNKIPTYNLKVVIKETGIKPDTLRAWERRYGLPEPERSKGGHRLYSEYDIEIVKWLSQRQKEGLRINRAVALWKEIESKGQDPLDAFPQTGVVSQQQALEIQAGETIKEMRSNWISACLAFDESTAEYILAQAFSRYPLETVCLDILREGLSEIGNLWYEGEATVQQEHFASSLTIRRLNALLTAAPTPTRSKRFMVACPPNEEHIIAPLMITLFLRNRGWDVIYLGANVPVAQLEETIHTTNPQLVIMTAMYLNTAAILYEVAKYLYPAGILLAYGGRIFNLHSKLRETIPGHFLGESLYDVVNTAEEIMTSMPKVNRTKPVDDDYKIALRQFRDRETAIETHIWDSLRTNGLKEYQIQIANDFLNRDIASALTLGSMDYLADEIKWIKMLLTNHNIPAELLPRYLDIYNEALNEKLSADGKIIQEWANNQLAYDSEVN